jgi:tight adherence protein B
LAQAGLGVTPRQFVVGSAAVGLVAFALGFFVTGTALVAIVPAIAAVSIPRAYFGRRRAAKFRELLVAWPDGLRDLGASIAAGRSLTHALTTLAETGPPPLRDAFSRFPTLARMLGTVPALEVVKSELADPTSDRVIEVLILAYERGGPIVKQILEDLVTATTKDVKVLEEIDSEGLEMKINARAVLVMPWLVLVALTVRPGPFRAFYQSAAGLLVVIVGGVLSGLGSWWISRLGRAHREQRVFGAAQPAPAGS